MANFIDITTAFEPKKEVRETVFTHFMDATGKWIRAANTGSKTGDYITVIYLGKIYQNEKEVDLFKAWDKSINDAVLFIGTKGDEEYQPF